MSAAAARYDGSGTPKNERDTTASLICGKSPRQYGESRPTCNPPFEAAESHKGNLALVSAANL
jgi:hypothetical protein